MRMLWLQLAHVLCLSVTARETSSKPIFFFFFLGDKNGEETPVAEGMRWLLKNVVTWALAFDMIARPSIAYQPTHSNVWRHTHQSVSFHFLQKGQPATPEIMQQKSGRVPFVYYLSCCSSNQNKLDTSSFFSLSSLQFFVLVNNRVHFLSQPSWLCLGSFDFETGDYLNGGKQQRKN